MKRSKLLLIGLVFSVLVASVNATAVTSTTYSNPYDDINWEDFGLTTDDVNASMAFLFTCCVVVLVIMICVGIPLCIWLYKDAEKRGKNGVTWAIILILGSLLLPLLGTIIILAIWYSTRPSLLTGAVSQDDSMIRCTNCGRLTTNEFQFCPYCGKPFDDLQDHNLK